MIVHERSLLESARCISAAPRNLQKHRDKTHNEHAAMQTTSLFDIQHDDKMQEHPNGVRSPRPKHTSLTSCQLPPNKQNARSAALL